MGGSGKQSPCQHCNSGWAVVSGWVVVSSLAKGEVVNMESGVLQSGVSQKQILPSKYSASISDASKHPVFCPGVGGAQSKAHTSESRYDPIVLQQSSVLFEQVMFVREGLGSGGQVMGGEHCPCQHCNSPSAGWVVVSGWVGVGEVVVRLV